MIDRPSLAPDTTNPTISILIPSWNAEVSIERALSSVLDQEEVQLECIVVDDGSTDATAAIVQRFADRDPRVVLLRLDTNVGVSAARNRGLELIHGAWLTLVDADDRLLPGALRLLLDAALRTDALAVVGQQVWSDGSRTWLGRAYDIPDIRDPGRKSLLRNPGLLYFASPHGKLIHRSCIERLEFHGRVLGDQPWTIRALLRAGERIEVIADTVYEWVRPQRTVGVSTITTRTRSSAQLGAEVAAVAEVALMEVREEAGRVLQDPKARDTVAGKYLARLLRSDLGGLVARALWRGDPTTATLLVAMDRFVSTVPAELLSSTSDALATSLLAPPLRHWYRLPADAWPAYWALFDTSLRIDPEAIDRARNHAERVGLRLASPRMGLARHVTVGLLLTVAWVWASVGARIRVGRRSRIAPM